MNMNKQVVGNVLIGAGGVGLGAGLTLLIQRYRSNKAIKEAKNISENMTNTAN